jgi:hypothetical protein
MRKLPVFAALQHVFSTVLNNVGMAFKVSWAWIIVLIAPGLYFAYSLPSDPEVINSQPEKYASLLTAIAVFAIFQLIAFASIAVNWHRYILLNEVPVGKDQLRLDGHVWRYIGNSLLASLMVMFPFGFLVGFAFAIMNPSAEALQSQRPLQVFLSLWPLLIIMVLCAAFLYRMLIKLPAVALGRRDYKFPNALADSKGSFWNIVGFVLLFSIALMLPSLALGWLSGLLIAALGVIGALISAVLQVLYQWLSLIIGISALTSLYGFFAEKREF